MDAATSRTALQAAEAFPQVYAASAAIPTTPRASTTPTSPTSSALAAHPRCAAIGETGPGLLPRLRAARRPGARLPRPDRARARDGQAARHPHARRRGRHDRDAAGPRRTASQVILHCFSMPDRLDECLAEGWWISFAGNVTYPKATDLAAAAERVPDDRLLVETDAPYLTPQAVRKERNQPAFVTHTARFVAERRGVAYEELERRRRAQRCRRCSGGDAGEPAATPAEPAPHAPVRRAPQARPRPELPHRLEHPRGDRAGGRARARRRRARDRRRPRRAQRAPRAERAAHVHVVEVDRALVPALRGRARRRTRTRRCTSPTRSTLDLRRPRTRADEGRRQPAVRHRGQRDPAHVEELAGVTRWVAMVQREVGERFAAAPGTLGLRRPVACSPSSRATCACTARSPRTVFHPVPERRLGARRAATAPAPAPPPALRALVRAAFAHRRKALARSLALVARRTGPTCATAPARRSQALGHPADVRAERLAPEEFRALAEALR